MGDEKAQENTVMLKGVTLSFPDLFEPVQYQGTGPFNYRASFLVKPGSENHKAIEAALLKVATAKWEKKANEYLPGIRGASNKCCYISGDQKAYAGYAGNMALTASRKKTDGAPLVMLQNKAHIKEDNGELYGGCPVNAKVQFWAQDNDFGKALRCTVITVQKAGDGEAFGGAPPASDAGFDEVETVDVDDLV